MDKQDHYDDVVHKAVETMELAHKSGYTIVLFTSGGAMMVRTDAWTLGGYLKQTHRSSSQTRFGIGYVKTVCLVIVSLANWCASCIV